MMMVVATDTVSAAPGVVDHYNVTAGEDQTAGTGFTALVQAVDSDGNLVSSATTTVHIELYIASTLINSNAELLQSDFTTPASDNQPLVGGQLTLYMNDTVAETIYIVISSASFSGASDPLVINPAAIAYYIVESTTPQVAGVGWSGTATAYDVYDNMVNTDDETVVTMTENGDAVFYTDATYTTTGNTYTLSAGVATFYVRDTVAQTITLTVSDDFDDISAFIEDIVVNPAPIDHFNVVVGGAPMSKEAGASWTDTTNDVVVTAHDEFSNVVTIYTGSPTWSASCAGTLPTAQAFVLGTSTFLGSGFALNIAGEQTVTMTDGVITGNSAFITITPADIAHYHVASSSPQVAGEGWSGTVTAHDAYHNVVTTDSETEVTMSNDDGEAEFYTSDSYDDEDDEYTLTSGVATFYVLDTKAETITLSVMDEDENSGEITDIVVLPAEIDHFDMEEYPAGTMAGNDFGDDVIVTAYDVFGNVKTNYVGTVHWTSSDPYPADLPGDYTFVLGDAGVHAFAGGDFILYTTESQTITVSDMANSVTLTSESINVDPATIDHYVVASSSPQVAGVGWSGTMTAYDEFDNIVTTDSTTWVTMLQWGSELYYPDASYASGKNYGDYQLSAGVATFYVKDTVAEGIVLTGFDYDNVVFWYSSTIIINPSWIDHYHIASTTPQTAGVGWSGTVTAHDIYHNVVNTDSSTQVVMGNIGNAVFYTNGTYTTSGDTYTLSSGVATFYARDTVAETIDLTVWDNTAIGANGYLEDIVINPAAIEYYMVSFSSPQIAGVGWSGTATAYDFFGNIVNTDSTTVVTMTENGDAVFYTSNTYATPGDTYTLSAGVATFYVRDTVAQTITLTATDGNSKTGYIPGIVVNPAGIDYYVVASSTPQIAGVGWSGTATAYDEFDNIVTTDSETEVTMSNDDGSAMFYTSATYATPGDTYTLSSGVATFYVRDTVAQTITLSVMDEDENSGSIGDIVVLPAAIDHFSIEGCPESTIAGTPFESVQPLFALLAPVLDEGITVTAYDVFGNVKTNYVGTVHWTSSDPYPADLPGDYTFVLGDAGVHTFSNSEFVLYTTPSQTITATDTVDAVTLTSEAIVVLPADIDHYHVVSTTPQIAGVGWSGTATAHDAYHNVVTTDSETEVTMSNDDGSAMFYTSATYATPGDTYTLSSGVATFYVRDTVAQTITLTATDENDMTGEITGIVVLPAEINHFVMINYPGVTYAGAAFVASVTVTAYDVFGNVKTNYVGTVHWTSSDPYPADLPGDYTFVLGDAGVHTFVGADFILYTTPYQTITVTDTVDAVTLTSVPMLVLVDDRPIDIVMDVGTIHFPGEIVAWWMLMTVNGQPFDPTTMVATLYAPDLSTTDMSGEMYMITSGLWVVNWTIPGDALAGQYTLVLMVNDGFSYGSSLRTFVISATLIDMNARIVSMDGNITLVQTDIGLIQLDLTDISALATSINGTLVMIQTSIGNIEADISAINGSLTAIEGDIATIQTDIGTIHVDIADIKAYIASINGTLVTIQTDIGAIQVDIADINALLVSINGTLATIQTDIGAIQVDIAAIHALAVSMNGTLVTIQTDIGAIQVDIAAIDGRLTAIEGDIATIQTDIGAIQVDIADINALLVSINGTLATIQTDIGSIEANITSINAYIASINGTLVTIQTSIGSIEADISDINGRLTAIEGNIAIIKTDIGTIRTNIASINGILGSINGKLATIQTDIGTIQENITDINGRLTAIEGTIATIQTDIGTIQVNLTAINTTVTSIKNNVATIETSLGTLTGNVTSIRGNIATIQTKLGTMQADVSGIQAETQSNNIYNLISIGLLVSLVVILLVGIYVLMRRRSIF